MILGLHHILIAAPPGCEAEARGFYTGLLGMPEIPKSENLRGRGGVWFRSGGQEIHVGVEQEWSSCSSEPLSRQPHRADRATVVRSARLPFMAPSLVSA